VFAAYSNARADNNNHKEGEEGAQNEAGHESHREETGMGTVYLSEMKFDSLGMKIDALPSRILSGVVEANGHLEVPPLSSKSAHLPINHSQFVPPSGYPPICQSLSTNVSYS